MQQETDYRIDIQHLTELIDARGAKSVGLQLPEGLLRRARSISKEIQNRCDIPVIISGRGCYGACDIDTALSEMVDLLFHFGHSGEDRENIVFVEVRSKVNICPVVQSAIAYLEGDRIALVTTIQHVEMIEEAKKILETAGKEVLIRCGSGDGLRYEGQVLGCNASAVDPRSDEVLFIGTGLFHPKGIASLIEKKVVAADPYTKNIELIDPEPLIRRRWVFLEKALDAHHFGVILSPKIGQYKQNVADEILKSARDHDIEAHLILLDEIREDALINLGMDAYVNTACCRIVDDMRKVILLNPDEFARLLRMRDGV